MHATDRDLVHRVTTSAADWYRGGLEQFAEGMLHALSLILIDHGAEGYSVKSECAIAAAAVAIGFGALAGATPSLKPTEYFSRRTRIAVGRESFQDVDEAHRILTRAGISDGELSERVADLAGEREALTNGR